jgi:hypothetical protein
VLAGAEPVTSVPRSLLGMQPSNGIRDLNIMPMIVHDGYDNWVSEIIEIVPVDPAFDAIAFCEEFAMGCRDDLGYNMTAGSDVAGLQLSVAFTWTEETGAVAVRFIEFDKAVDATDAATLFAPSGAFVIDYGEADVSDNTPKHVFKMLFEHIGGNHVVCWEWRLVPVILHPENLPAEVFDVFKMNYLQPAQAAQMAMLADMAGHNPRPMASRLPGIFAAWRQLVDDRLVHDEIERLRQQERTRMRVIRALLAEGWRF